MQPLVIRQNVPPAMAPRVGARWGPAVKGSTLTADQINDLADQGQRCQEVPHMKAVVGVSADDAKAVADYVQTPEVEEENQRLLQLEAGRSAPALFLF